MLVFCTVSKAGTHLTSMVGLSSIAGSPINTRTLVEKAFCSALIFLSINQRVKYQPSNSGEIADEKLWYWNHYSCC